MATEATMEKRMTRRERYYMYNTLLSLAKSLEKRCTTVDLRNESTVTGTLAEVDGFMNIVMTDAALYDSDDNYYYFPMLYVQARNIRNVHIPDNVNIITAIKDQVAVGRKNKPTPKPRTFKQSRAKKQQEETLKLVQQIIESRKTKHEASSDSKEN